MCKIIVILIFNSLWILLLYLINFSFKESNLGSDICKQILKIFILIENNKNILLHKYDHLFTPTQINSSSVMSSNIWSTLVSKNVFYSFLFIIFFFFLHHDQSSQSCYAYTCSWIKSWAFCLVAVTVIKSSGFFPVSILSLLKKKVWVFLTKSQWQIVLKPLICLHCWSKWN